MFFWCSSVLIPTPREGKTVKFSSTVFVVSLLIFVLVSDSFCASFPAESLPPKNWSAESEAKPECSRRRGPREAGSIFWLQRPDSYNPCCAGVFFCLATAPVRNSYRLIMLPSCPSRCRCLLFRTGLGSRSGHAAPHVTPSHIPLYNDQPNTYKMFFVIL